MEPERHDEEHLLRSVTLQSAKSILAARQRADQQLREAKQALEQRTEQLARSLAMMRATLESTTDGILVTDGDGKVTGFNTRFAEMWGLPREMLEAGDYLRLLHTISGRFADPDAFIARAQQIGGSAAPESFDLLRLGDGRTFERFSRVQIIDDQRVGRVWSFRDVTEHRRAEEAHRRLAAIVESSDDAIAGKALDGTITSWNAAAERLYGYSAAEIIGRNFSLLVPADRADDSRQSAERIRQGERLSHFETLRRRKDGSLVDVSVSYSPIKDDDGRIVGISAITRNISQRRRAEEAIRTRERQLQLVTDNAPVLIAHCDPQRRFKFVNRPYAQRFGLHPKDLIGKTIAEVIGDEAYASIARQVDTVLSGQRVEFEAELNYREVGTQHLLCAYEPEFDSGGRVVGFVAAITNVTERKRIDRALQEEARTTETLYRIGRTLAAELDLRQVVQTVTDEATGLTGAQFGAFFYNVLDESGESYTLYSISGAPREAFTQFPMPRNTAIFEPTFRGRDIVRLDDVTQDPRYGQNPPYQGMPEGHLPVRSYLAVPVVSRSGEVLGGLFFGHAQAGMFQDRHERLVRGIAAQAAVAIDNARLYGQVRESEQRFRQLAENIREVFWMTDLQKDTLLFVSPAFEEVWGRSRESLYERPESYFDAIHPEDRQGVQAESRAAQRRGEPTDVQYRVVRPDGSVRWVRDRSFPIRDASGSVYRTVGIAEDITERRHAESSARFLADASAALAVVVDYESTLRRVAGLAVPAFADWCTVDLAEADATLRRLAVVHADASKMALAEQLRRAYPAAPDAVHGPYQVLRTGEPQMVTEVDDAVLRQAVRNEGHLQIVRDLGVKSFVCVPLRSRNKILGVLSFVYAGSGRRYEDRDLALALELGRRAATAIENARLYADLREADRRKDEFLAMLAHELRNPLAPIRTGLDLLAMDSGVDSETVGVMQQQVAHLARLVDDLLDVSRIVRGRIELRRQRVELGQAIRRSVDAVDATVEARRQQLVMTLPPHEVWIDADPVRLAQILENLLNNASKYTDEGGRVEIVGEQREDQAVISVRDTGIGIEADLLPNVFDLFTQSARSLDRSQGGLGIGLTLVRSLVELHGGEIAAYSDGPGKGSRFDVSLPIAASAPEAAPVPAAASVSPGRRVLVVDDSVGAAKMMALLVKRLGPHEIQIAHDGPTALEMAKAFLPEIILLDIGLPRMDGLTVAWTLRQSGEFDDALLVALTGYGQEEDRRKSREAGFDEHHVKPVSIETLSQLLSHHKLAKR